MATEEQTLHDTYQHMYSGNFIRQGQRLTISDRRVIKLGFWLWKVGAPAGDITFTIRKIDNMLLASGVLGDASLLQGSANFEEATIATPVIINEEVRILCEWGGGDADNRVEFESKDSDVKGGEFLTEYYGVTWYDRETKDAAYIYTYGELGWIGKISGVTNPAKIMGVDVANIAKVKGVA